MGKASVRIKRSLWVASLNVVLVFTLGTTQAFADPIPVSSVVELLEITGNGDYVLTENLDLSNEDADESIDGTQLADLVTTTSSVYIPTLTGTFDGGNFTIFGLTKPLFYYIDGIYGLGEISNLTLEADDSGVTGPGILASVATSGSWISNVHASGNVNGGSDIGGLVGYNVGEITGSSAAGGVIGNNNVGGLVGYNNGNISNSSAAGDVIASGVNAGGLSGNNFGNISNSSATGAVSGTDYVGGLVGLNDEIITNSYSESTVDGAYYTGGLTGYNADQIANSYATSTVDGIGNYTGGLVGYNVGAITNSYAVGAVGGAYFTGGLTGINSGTITNSYATGDVIASGEDAGGLAGDNYDGAITNSYATGTVNGDTCDGCSILTATELLAILNTGDASPVFALDPSINAGRPYLISNAPPGNDGGNDEEGVSPRFISSYLPTQILDSLSKSVGFEVAKSNLNKLDLAFLDEVKGEKSAPITGAKLFANQSLTTSLSVGSLLQLEINFEANKSLQMWVKSSDDQYVLVGNVTFDKDGNAVLPGIEFKKSGQYELIFVNSDRKDLTQPELVNKVSGLTVYVN